MNEFTFTGPATNLESGNGGGISRRGVMAAALLPFAAAPVGGLAGIPSTASRGTPEYVAFDDVAPGYLTLTQSWNALGMDDQDRLYIIWTSTRSDGREDSALFRYTHATGRREFLGTFIDAATAAGNVRPGEQIPKGHTRILQVGRRMYMASQGFHDFKGEIGELPTYRGAHLFSYDLDTGVLADVSSGMPDGVVIRNQGIVAMSYSPEHNLLVGLAHPLGHLVLIDVRTNAVRKVVEGIPWELGRVVSREIVVTRTGKVYAYRGPEDPSLRDMTNEVWSYDLADLRPDTMRRTGQHLRGGFWNGQAVTGDRDTIYLSTVSGELYRLDVRSGRFTHLGHFVDPADHSGPDRYRVAYLYGIALAKGETEILGAPIILPTATGSQAGTPTRLTAYSVPRRTFTRRRDLERIAFTGSNHRDRRGNIYQAAFDWNTNCRLAVFEPPYT
jgi:hypothetical protein